MNRLRPGTMPAALVAILFAAGGAFAAHSVYIGAAAGAPGTTAPVPVNYTADTNDVLSLQFDLLYSTNYLSSSNPIGGSALADHLIGSAEVSSGVRRVLIFSLSNTLLTNGTLAFVPFLIATNAMDHGEDLALTNVILVNVAAEPVLPVTVVGGSLTIATPPRISPVTVTDDGVAHMQLTGTTDSVYSIQGSTNLHSAPWTTLYTNKAVGGVLEFNDTSASGFPWRFYRARVQP